MALLDERERQQVAEGLTPRVAAKETLELYRDTRTLERRQRRLTFIDWALQIPEPKTGTLNWEAFPFQPEMYEAMGSAVRQLVVTKATQLGISALTVRWALYEADRNGRTILYVFPTSDDVYDFSDARITPMFDASEYLMSRMGQPFNKGLKRVGVGLVYFRGSESKRKLDSVDADGVAFDEYDTLNQSNIPDAERRLSGVLSAGLIRRIGVPSIPDFGIHDKFKESDRREWLVRCEACGHLGTDKSRGGEPVVAPRGRGWQMVDFWDNVDQARAVIVCAGCGEPLDVGRGRWVAQQPGGEWPGFHVSRLIVPNMRLGEIVKASRLRTPWEQTVFYNKDLGLPFVHSTARINPEDVKACVRDFVMAPGYVGPAPVTMGVDVASERALNVKISVWESEEVQRTLWIGELEDGDEGTAFDQLALLMDRYCLAPETRVLCGDLIWRPLSEVNVGDSLLAFDETTSRHQRRSFRFATVESNDRITRPCYEVVFEDGRRVTASAEHLWLQGRRVPRAGYRKVPCLDGWIATADLHPGVEISDLGQPWPSDDSWDAGYLVGVFDGEASIRRTSPGFVISFSQKPGKVMDDVVRRLEARGLRPTPARVSNAHGVALTTIRGAYDTLRFLGECRPARLLSVMPEWIEGRLAAGTGQRQAYGEKRARGGYAVVQSVEYVGEREVIAIGTSTRTLFAEGLFSHNSVNMAAVDSQPETRLARAFLARFPGRAYLCNIIGSAKQALSIDEDLRSVSVIRTFLLDHLAENVKRQRNLLPLDLPDGYIEHLGSNVRRVERDELDRVKVFWQKTRDDDYAMAEAINLVAAEAFWIRLQVQGALDEDLRPLESFLTFRRSAVDDLEDAEWSPGPSATDPLAGWEAEDDDLRGAGPVDEWE